MGETTIAVRGTGEGRRPAQRVMVSVRGEYEGEDRAQVVELATASAAEVAATLTALAEDDGAVATWSAERLNAWSQRPYTSDGSIPPLRHHASVTTTATFVGFDAFAEWVVDRAADEAITVESIVWDLDPVEREAMLAEVRTAAVQDAVATARTYASALGLTELRPLAVADPGLLGERVEHAAAPMALAKAAAPSGQMSFRPEDIGVSVVVEARFAATAAGAERP